MRKKLFGANGGFGLRQAKRRVGCRKRQDLNVKTRRHGPAVCPGPDYIQHAEVPRGEIIPVVNTAA
jgi:hypothetical protein